MKIKLIKETQCAHDVYEMTKYPRPWFKPKPALPEGIVLTVDSEWSNFYGSYYRCTQENGTYDIPISSAEVID